MKKIGELENKSTRNSIHVSDGPVEADPEYVLIVDANNLAVEIDNEICEYVFVGLVFNFYFVLKIIFFSYSQP